MESVQETATSAKDAVSKALGGNVVPSFLDIARSWVI